MDRAAAGVAGETQGGGGAKYREAIARAERAEADADRLAAALEQMWCPNCSDRKCMACVFREIHDHCADTCPECCERPNVIWTDRSPQRYADRAAALDGHEEAVAQR